ncbi:MAG: hypothetical protein Q8N55_03785 [bacterium]|nr:hypothetical protein [bacterium]
MVYIVYKGEEVCNERQRSCERTRADEASSQQPLKPPANWQYLPVKEAVEAWRNVFGSSIKTNGLIDKAENFNPWQKGEGINVCPSLPFLFREFEIAKELGISEDVDLIGGSRDSLAAYAKIAELWLELLGKEYNKATGYSFKNWRAGQLSSKHIQLTSGGRIAWQQLMEMFSGSDFVAAPASSGSICAGHSVRRSRVKIILRGGLPQDIIMVSGTLMVQPERLTKYEHLSIDVPGNQYSFGASGSFPRALHFPWRGGARHCDCGFAAYALSGFGSASLCLGQ